MLPLDPPAGESEIERASVLWTAAMDTMVSRGYARHLWGNLRQPARDCVTLLLRLSKP